jgi:geranylgeranyl diphosphate synthase type II
VNFDHAGKIIEKAIQEITLPAEPSALYDPIRYTLEMGGKRIRPSLLLVAHGMYNRDPEDAISPAIGMEVFHNFTLLHDDIMDNAPVRRNKPTVHEKWNRNVAILSGDVMSILAYQFLSRTRTEVIPEIINLFNKTAIEVCEGQQFDMDFESMDKVNVDQYIRMIDLKTSVLIAACLKMGAIIGGAKPADGDFLYEFGRNLGIAFQLTDDYLDTFGEEKKFGKKIGGDILSNKKTFLLIRALELAEGMEQKELKRWINATEFDPEEKIASVTSIFSKLHVDRLIVEEMDNYYNRSLEYLERLDCPIDNRSIIREFARQMMKREN